MAQKLESVELNGANGNCYKFHFDYFNAVPSDKKPRSNIQDIKDADVFMIVVENEYQYATNKINPMYRQYLDERLEKIRKELDNKTIIILNSDIQHTPSLIYDYTLQKAPIKDLFWISENDIDTNYHTLKFYNLRQLSHLSDANLLTLAKTKIYDFAYWGSYRQDSPERQQVLTAIRKQHPSIKSFYVGHLPPFTDMKWTRKFIEAVPDISKARTTICFGVDENPTWLTAKYHEAMGMRIIPFIWTNYDTERRLGELDWQVVSSTDELVHKIEEVKDDRTWASRFSQIEKSYLSKIGTEEEIYDIWIQSVMPKLMT